MFPKTRDELHGVVKIFVLASGRRYLEPNVVFMPSTMLKSLEHLDPYGSTAGYLRDGVECQIFGMHVIKHAPEFTMACVSHGYASEVREAAMYAYCMNRYYGMDVPNVFFHPELP